MSDFESIYLKLLRTQVDERPIHQGNKQSINIIPEVDFSRMPLLSTEL